MHSPNNAGNLPQRKVGDVLLSKGRITEEQLEEALEIQKAEEGNLGEILISLGYITYDDLAQALSGCLNVEYVSLSEVEIDPNVLGIIGEDVLLQHRAVLVRAEDGRLIVAMSDPSDGDARSDLTVSAGCPVTPVIADEDAIRHLQNRWFGRESTARNAVTELTDAIEGACGADATKGDGKAERREPGAQPEVDLGEPVVEPDIARDAVAETAPEYKVESRGRSDGGSRPASGIQAQSRRQGRQDRGHPGVSEQDHRGAARAGPLDAEGRPA